MTDTDRVRETPPTTEPITWAANPGTWTASETEPTAEGI